MGDTDGQGQTDLFGFPIPAPKKRRGTVKKGHTDPGSRVVEKVSGLSGIDVPFDGLKKTFKDRLLLLSEVNGQVVPYNGAQSLYLFLMSDLLEGVISAKQMNSEELLIIPGSPRYWSSEQLFGIFKPYFGTNPREPKNWCFGGRGYLEKFLMHSGGGAGFGWYIIQMVSSPFPDDIELVPDLATTLWLLGIFRAVRKRHFVAKKCSIMTSSLARSGERMMVHVTPEGNFEPSNLERDGYPVITLSLLNVVHILR